MIIFRRNCTITFKIHISNTLKSQAPLSNTFWRDTRAITKKKIYIYIYIYSDVYTKTCLNSQFLEKYSNRQSNLTSFPITQKIYIYIGRKLQLISKKYLPSVYKSLNEKEYSGIINQVQKPFLRLTQSYIE